MIIEILFALLMQAKTAAVRGKVVVADSGSPVKYAAVQLRRSGAGQETFTVTTDASGAFEILDIEPGAYFATAAKPGFVNARYKSPDDDSAQLKLRAGQVENVDFRLPRAAVISGTITDMYGEPVTAARVQVLVKTYRQGRAELTQRNSTQTDDRGEYRLYGLSPGRYYVQAGKGASSPQGSGLAATIFPNASRMEDAQAISVKPGEERQAIDLILPEATVFSVIGRVVDVETGQAPGMVFLNLTPQDWGMGTNTGTQVRPDGTFRLNDVAPARYRLFGQVITPQAPPGKGVQMNFNRILDLRNGNTSDLTIRVGPGSTVKGRVKADGGTLPGELQITLTSESADGFFLNGLNAKTNAEGVFEIAHVQAGFYELAANALNQPGEDGTNFLAKGAPSLQRFFLSSVSAGSRIVTDKPFEVGDSGTVELSVTIDLRPASVSGKALDANDKPASNISVALISADPAKRLLSNYFRRAQTGHDGGFKLTGATPGEYLLLPWLGEDASQLLDPDVFTMIEKHATRIALERGANIAQDLRLTLEIRTLAEAFAQ